METAVERYCGDDGAAYWERNRERLEKERITRRRAIRSLVRTLASESWLEVGCGRGFNLYAGDVGVDCDARQLQYLPAGVIGVIGQAHDLRMFPDRSFPVVFSVGCLMHLPDEQPGEVPSPSWQRAVAEMARVSRHAIILGEYWAEEETSLTHSHWTGALWARPYTVPGFQQIQQVRPLPPFDSDITFTTWTKHE